MATNSGNVDAGQTLATSPRLEDQRGHEANTIREAYDRADDALRHIGKLLRTCYAGEFMWSTDHKTAISGLRVVVKKLRNDVPYRLTRRTQ